MRKNIGIKPAIFPMPVLMIATYNEDNSVDVMNAAWGMMVDNNIIALNLTETHKTVKNIKTRGAFTVSIADVSHLKEADYFGIVSSNKVKDKFLRTNLTASKSDMIDAPIIEEFPVTMECKFLEYQDNDFGCGVIGEIVNVSVLEEVIDENNNVNPTKINALIYEPFNHGYYSVGKKVGNAFKDGQDLK